nr:MAG TPA: hypothetical protein [Caudoviricetes sp.]
MPFIFIELGGKFRRIILLKITKKKYCYVIIYLRGDINDT